MWNFNLLLRFGKGNYLTKSSSKFLRLNLLEKICADLSKFQFVSKVATFRSIETKLVPKKKKKKSDQGKIQTGSFFVLTNFIYHWRKPKVEGNSRKGRKKNPFGRKVQYLGSFYFPNTLYRFPPFYFIPSAVASKAETLPHFLIHRLLLQRRNGSVRRPFNQRMCTHPLMAQNYQNFHVFLYSNVLPTAFQRLNSW